MTERRIMRRISLASAGAASDAVAASLCRGADSDAATERRGYKKAFGFRHSFVLRHSCFVISQARSPSLGRAEFGCDV